MTLCAELKPAHLLRKLLYSFTDRIVFNVMALSLPLLIILLFSGSGITLVSLLKVAGALVLLFVATALTLYGLHKDNSHTVSVSYEIGHKRLKITYGDEENGHVHVKRLWKRKVRRAWFNGKGIFIRYGQRTHAIVLPAEQRVELVRAMRGYGWFTTPEPSLPARLMKDMASLAMCGLLGLVLSLPLPHQAPTTAAELDTPKPLNPVAVVTVLTDKRTPLGKTPIAFDGILAQSAHMSCADMSRTQSYGNSGTRPGREYTQQFYDDRWVAEIVLAVPAGFTAEQAVSRWIDSPDTTDTILDTKYRIGAAATCPYTVDDQFDSIVVLHLSS